MISARNLIHAYVRSQAIADGVLVDVSERASELGFKWPVALTRAVYADCVEWTDEDNDRKGALQHESGRLHDVLWMASIAARSSSGRRTPVTLYRVPREGAGRKPRLVRLEMVITVEPVAHIENTPEPVITIQFPGED